MPEKPSPYRHFKALVVDDNNYARKLSEYALRKIGFQDILLALSVEHATQSIESCSGRIDLIVSDWNMPEKDGLDFFKELKQDPKTASIPFIMLTGMTGAEAIKEAQQEGIQYYLVKPFTEASLRTKVDHIFKDKI
ncbi:MAG: response regulator [Zetaproteobacteria bacterium]|nr:response regulator [Zetaproteobacteria bacterium]